MKSQWCRPVAMDLGVYQLRHFSISFLSSLLGTENASVRLDNSSSGASVVAIDNKIEQAMVCTDKSFVLNVGTAQKARCLGVDQ
uniref:TSC22 domain family member 1 n=1 Tax=Marmota marmota marmota TaxID=9994 RepID=A0A8C6EZK6_MARMA